MIEVGLACRQGWSVIVQDLLAEGLNDEEIATLLRQRNAWVEEAHEMKAEGYPYDEIVFHLTTLKASWDDVGRALMAVGISPADTLRVVFPCTDGYDHWPLVRAALLDGPENADYGEARGVLEFYLLSEEEILGALDLEVLQREQLIHRLELRD
ncbi:hypothetical protein GETHPA_28500 [Geothrix rubra]|uniref:Uncharacterized protein n=1 Tax=Geothrix rubra TaxID=2927977 RepID=A0ABQ5Q911_9BACT|nr:hypothetical protein [Geothrix rubra]GLH71317.1 hypothetical protein GETHPA_28500 [Geothrix rubra]